MKFLYEKIEELHKSNSTLDILGELADFLQRKEAEADDYILKAKARSMYVAVRGLVDTLTSFNELLRA
jgi:hypothetical protein